MQVKINLKEPHEKQAKFVYSNAKRVVLRCGRRGGKTTGVAIMAVIKLLEGRRILYATPTQEQIGRFWWEVTTAMKPAIEAGLYRKNESEKYIVPAHGESEARIKAKTAWNANTLRGDFADLLLLDEYQLMDPEVWSLVGAPMLLDNDGDAVFIYTSEQRALHASEMYKRAEKMMNEALAKGEKPRWEVHHFTSHANPHLSEVALEEITSDMTNLAYRLEIMAEDLDDDPRSLWTRNMLKKTRVLNHPLLTRIVVGIDPQGGMVGETGIVVGGVSEDGEGILHGYLLEDASISGSPATWASQAVTMYNKYEADALIAERNFGGDMVEATINGVDSRVPVKVVTASRGKIARAEPISRLMEKDRIHHVGEFLKLEDELCQYYQTKSKAQPSPNRYDAYVWCFSELMLEYCATELGTIQIPMV
jgi:hypothetical protein